MGAKKGNVVTLEVLSNGASQLNPCLLLRTLSKTYMFNIPESVQRFLPFVSLTPKNIHDIFVTKADWSHFGGLKGMLISKDRNDREDVRVFGAELLHNVHHTIRPFMGFDDDGKVTCNVVVNTAVDGLYEDDLITVFTIELDGDFYRHGNGNGKGSGDKKVKRRNCAFLVELKPKERQIDPVKLKNMKGPKGPLIGALKAGKSVTLLDGTVINPDDVLCDVEEETLPLIMFLEIESERQLECLMNSGVMQDHLQEGKTLSHIVHFTSEATLNSKWYQNFMDNMNGQHIIVNGSAEPMPIFDGAYENQHILGQIDSHIFPKLWNDRVGKVYRKTISSAESKIRPNAYESIIIRGKTVKKGNKNKENDSKVDDIDEELCFSITHTELEERINDNPAIKDVLDKFREDSSNINTKDTSTYPAIVFLGTASASPTKYRNVSGYLVRLSPTSTIMIDCGEGTYSQMKVLYGDELPYIMTTLSGLFITHGHLDHIYGLTTVVEERIKVFEQKGIPYERLTIVGNFYCKKFFDIYSRYFNFLEYKVRWVDSIAKHSDDYGEELSSLDLHIPYLESATVIAVDHIDLATGYAFHTLCGKKIVFSGDTKPCKNLVRHGMGADVLVHEATFEDAYAEDADRKRHCTTGQAVTIGKKMKVKYVILSHFSARYPRCPVLSNKMLKRGTTTVATDFMVLSGTD
ncbi:unnamed protein product [Bursaphelenchus okinawaensis]|uniref:ribonuclease Z n=1 Tax=Bursaphelenchus okinawaensis TaxID=465554 RepID=A0A811KET6_9BILA|nr:unnamed protein product [Bursaphelenchus okinawaensis]CAG9101901.1 unnamed protein product [Bursaphelenchus okinawaensis]